MGLFHRVGDGQIQERRKVTLDEKSQKSTFLSTQKSTLLKKVLLLKKVPVLKKYFYSKKYFFEYPKKYFYSKKYFCSKKILYSKKYFYSTKYFFFFLKSRKVQEFGKNCFGLV